ncbi:MAG TPA: gamma-glutamyl-gamma-aminobutyrate hydrolase family protein [Kofleriaceae bacterium]|nr:gamma-glutamyl-gamma-aminobutyrate hydrolase family protein [Kofleriaceae bacterium]
MTRRPLCIVVCGDPMDEVGSQFGSFVDWFARLVGDLPVSPVAVDAHAPRLPRAREMAGIVITGSPASVAAPEAWMGGVAELMVAARAAGTPVFGVCFGHQLLAFAAGGQVIQNPTGWEMGTYEVELLPAAAKEPLTRPLATAEGPGSSPSEERPGSSPSGEARFLANFSHRDCVVAATLPAEVTVLAKNARADVQMLAWGETSFGVQFHPEFSADITRAYIAARADELIEDLARRGARWGELSRPERDKGGRSPTGVSPDSSGQVRALNVRGGEGPPTIGADERNAPDDHPEALLPRVKECPDSEAIFQRFITGYVLRA